MVLLLFSLALFFIGGCAALFSRRTAPRVGAFFAVVASVTGLVPAGQLLLQSLHSGSPAALTATIAKLPMGELSLCLDLMSAVFLVPVLLLTAISALYGMGHCDGSCKVMGGPGHPGAHWFFYNLLAGGMVLTLTASDAFLFLLAWEIMSITPFFLISMNDNSAPTRTAAWTYLIAAHLGVLFLLAFFALLSAVNGNELSFAAFAAKGAVHQIGAPTGLLFILMLLGFGAKTGFMPLHVWMPAAYSAAPGHVAAVMSGAMVNMGIYGILRCLEFLGTGDAWWAYTLLGIGAFSGFVGILRALAQPDINRSLAFSSVENMGIISMAIGVALLCRQTGHTDAAALAATGALVHMFNHALVKGLLFLCAGCVLNGAGTVMLRYLGGLQKRMPFVGWCFALGSAAMAALPPLNGFAGEFLIYNSMVFGGTAFAQGLHPEYSLVFWICLFILAGMGGFALLCFTRLFGIAFLGSPRSDEAEIACPPPKNQIVALATLAALCILSAYAAPKIATVCHAAMAPALYAGHSAPATLAAAPPASTSASLAHRPSEFTAPHFSLAAYGDNSAITLLRDINGVFTLFILTVIAVYVFRRRLLRERPTASSPTWDCGYIAPTARMQYTAGSFSRPAAWFMRTLLRQKSGRPSLTEYFPLKARATLTTPDWIETKGYEPLFSAIERLADWCKALQHGRVNGYILYILITIVALLAWELR